MDKQLLMFNFWIKGAINYAIWHFILLSGIHGFECLHTRFMRCRSYRISHAWSDDLVANDDDEIPPQTLSLPDYVVGV